MLKAAVAGISSAAVGNVISANLRAGDDATVSQIHVKQRCPDAPRVRGPFPILSTPFTESGEVDYEVLAREARFANWCGSPGMIWPQSNDSIDLLTRDEKLEGMEVLTKTARDLKTTALCLGVQGNDTDEMLVYAKHAEKLAPAAIISRPPDLGKTQDDLRQYWRTLASVVTMRPVILQTTGTGGRYKGPAPAVDLMIELAEAFPNFGYVKEEAGDVLGRTKKLVASPSIRRVFSARGAYGWLKEAKIGTEGLISERIAYADLLAHIWKLMQSGKDQAALEDAYGKLALMLHLPNGGCLRGFHLHVLKMRGVFRNTISRHYGPHRSVPDKPIFSELNLSEKKIVEVEKTFESLKPYLKPGEFSGKSF